MPIYEYQCDRCDKVLEIWQKITEDALTECPECGGPIERLMSASAFHLKGSGWYKTDYKKGASSGNNDKRVEAKVQNEQAAAQADKSASTTSSDASSSSASSSSSDTASSSPADGTNHSK